MSWNSFGRWLAAAAVLVVALAFAGQAARAFDPNALWNIVNGRCVPNQQQHGEPNPCVQVDLGNGVEHGYAVLKDAVGASQFLMLPTERMIGIESPLLLAPDATNYFAAAWTARRFVEGALGHALPIDTVGLAVNSVLARTQNQLHIHIDCLGADVRATLTRLGPTIGEHWAPLSEPLNGHTYRAMRVMGTELGEHNPFKLLAADTGDTDMAQRTLVVAGMLFENQMPGFVILTDHTDVLHVDFAAGARLEDHDCALAR